MNTNIHMNYVIMYVCEKAQVHIRMCPQKDTYTQGE